MEIDQLRRAWERWENLSLYLLDILYWFVDSFLPLASEILLLRNYNNYGLRVRNALLHQKVMVERSAFQRLI